ncbi:MAG: OPT/YSL family transporter [Candidatus Bathyarchaeia archaeon]
MGELKKIGLSLKSLLLGILLSLAIIFWMQFGEFMSISDRVRPITHEIRWPGGPLFGYPIYNGRWSSRQCIMNVLCFMVVSVLLSRVIRLSRAELAFVFSMIAPASLYTGMLNGMTGELQMTYLALRNVATADVTKKFLSPLFGPLDMSVLEPMQFGSALVPWSAWFPTLLYLILLNLSMFFFGIFSASIVRAQFIEIESLPFPYANIINETIGKNEKQKYWKVPLFWIGFLVSLIYEIYEIIGHFYPPIEYPQLQIDLTLYAWYTGVLGFTCHPPIIGLGLFAPIDAIVSMLLAYVLFFNILPPVFVAMGQLEPLPPGRMTYLVWNRWIGKFEWSPYTWFRQGYIPFFSGMIFAIGIWPFIVHRRYLIGSLKRALFGEKVDRKEISSRYLWLFWFLSGLAWLILAMTVGVPLYMAILIMILIGVTWMSSARTAAETGGYFGATAFLGGDGYPMNLAMLIQATSGRDPAITLNSYLIGDYFVGAPGYWGVRPINSTWLSLESYKTGSLAECSNKHILYAQILGTIITVVVAFPFALWLIYTYGLSGRATFENTIIYANTIINTGNIQGPAAWQPNESVPIMMAFGFIITVVIYALRARFGPPFTILSPTGMLLAQYYGIYLFVPFIIALILKVLVLKIGGTPLFESKVVPLALGLIIGTAVLWLPASIALALRGMGYVWW